MESDVTWVNVQKSLVLKGQIMLKLRSTFLASYIYIRKKNVCVPTTYVGVNQAPSILQVLSYKNINPRNLINKDLV